MKLTPSDLVYLHPLRFADKAQRGYAVVGGGANVQREALARWLVVTAIVACTDSGDLELKPGPPRFGFLPLAPNHRLLVRRGTGTGTWPPGTLEANLAQAVGLRRDEFPLARVLADCLRPSLDPLGLVDAALRSRGAAELEPLRDTTAADETQSLLSGFREREPQLWLDLHRTVERALRAGALSGLLAAPAGPVTERRHRRRDHLRGWRRLNPDPPSATRPRKP